MIRIESYTYPNNGDTNPPTLGTPVNLVIVVIIADGTGAPFTSFNIIHNMELNDNDLAFNFPKVSIVGIITSGNNQMPCYNGPVDRNTITVKIDDSVEAEYVIYIERPTTLVR